MDQDDEAFRQHRITTIRDVRHSVVRINYKWKPGKDDVILAGTVVSKNGSTCVILANYTFRNMCKEKGSGTFGIRFPISDFAYGDEETYDLDSPNVLNIDNQFIRLNLTIPELAVHYIVAATFETDRITPRADVDVFMFPRKVFAAPPIYSPGSIVDATPVDTTGYFYVDVPVHEYGHFGSPLFNYNGHVVGIIFASQSRLQAWSVKFLQSSALRDLSAKYVACGNIIHQ